MAIAFEGYVTGGETGYAGTPVDVTLNLGTNAGRAVAVVVIGDSGLANSISSVTVDPAGSSVALTADTERNYGSNDNVRFFYLASDTLPTGSKTVRIAYTGDISIVAVAAVAYSGVNAISGVAYKAQVSSTTTPFITVASAVDSVAVALAMGTPSGHAGTAGGTERVDEVASGQTTFRAYCYEEPGAASVDVNWTTSTGIVFYGFGFSMSPSSGASAVPVISSYYQMLRNL